MPNPPERIPGPWGTPFARTVSAITDEDAGIRGGRIYDENVRDYERKEAGKGLMQGKTPGEIIAQLYDNFQPLGDLQLPAETPVGKQKQQEWYQAIHGLKNARPKDK